MNQALLLLMSTLPSDVVIGAPMEDDSGAVYIYHGSSNGIQLQYSQVQYSLSIRAVFKR